MSCHIYEGPDPETKTVRFSTRPQQDREETVVEIQQSADGGLLEPHQVARRPQTWSGPNSVWLKIIASGLFLLCVIQLFAVVSRTYQYVQEIGKPTPVLCPEGWTRFHCSCLFVSLEKKTWDLSRADCEQKGTDLIIIDSREKREFVAILTTESKQDLWIGLYKSKEAWTWVNDVFLAGHRAWSIGVSPDHAAEGSVAFMVEGGTWKYTKEGHKGYVCELKL